MKTVLLFILQLITLQVIAQSSCLLTGKVLFPLQRYILLNYETKYGIETHSDTIRLNEDNSFTYIWKFDTPSSAAELGFSPKKKLSIWVYNNGVLEMEVGDSIKQVIFSGNLAKYNQYYSNGSIKDWKNANAKFYARFTSHKNEEKVGSDNYYLIEDSILTERIQLLTKHFSKSEDTYGKEFVRFYADHIRFANFNYKLRDGEVDAILKFRPFQKLFKIHPTYSYSSPDEIDFTDTTLFRSGDFRYFLRSLLFTSTFSYQREVAKTPDWGWDYDSVYKNIFKMADRFSQPGELPNSLLKAAFMNIEVDFMSSMPYKEDTTEMLYTKYVDMLKNDPLIADEAFAIEKKLIKQLNQLGKLKKGAVAPVFNLTDVKNNTVDWRNFKGKFIYIDVWASWCIPCIQQIPEWNKLAEKFKDDKNVVFITISIDDSGAKWKKALQKYKPVGIALLSPGGWESEVSKLFNIKAVPASMLIDRDGKMLQQRAPSAKEIKLDELIHQ